MPPRVSYCGTRDRVRRQPGATSINGKLCGGSAESNALLRFVALAALGITLDGCESARASGESVGNGPSVLLVPYYTIVGDVRSSNSVSAYRIDPSTGHPALVTGSPFAAGSEPTLVALAPGGFAYVGNKRSGNVSAYKIAARTGALTRVPSSPFTLDYSSSGPSQIVVDPAGKHAYVASDAGISAFSINAQTGALVPIPGSPFGKNGSDGFGTVSIAIDPSDKFAYVLNYYRNTISTYTIDAAGALKSAGSTIRAGQNSNDIGAFRTVMIDPTGKFAYVAASCCVDVYSVDAATGTLWSSAHQRLGEPGVFALTGFAIDPAGKFAYGTNDNRIYAYSIDSASGRLRVLERQKYGAAAGSNVYGLTLDATGRFAYVSTGGTATSAIRLYGYRIDAATGALSPLARSPFTVAASTTDPVVRWFNTGRCAAFNGTPWNDAHSPPVAKRDSDLLFGHFLVTASAYFYDPEHRLALRYPRGDSGGTIVLRESGGAPKVVPRRDLSVLQTASGIKISSSAETVIRTLGEPKIVNGCGEQEYLYLKSKDGEPLSLGFTVRSGVVTEISEELGG